MKKIPCLVLFLLLLSLVTNVTAAKASEADDNSLSVYMYNFVTGHPVAPVLKCPEGTTDIQYSFIKQTESKFKNWYTSVPQLLAALRKTSHDHKTGWVLKVKCQINGVDAEATCFFNILDPERNFQAHLVPGASVDFVDFKKCLLRDSEYKDDKGNVLIRLSKKTDDDKSYSLFVSPNTPLGDYVLPIYQQGYSDQVTTIKVSVVIFEIQSPFDGYQKISYASNLKSAPIDADNVIGPITVTLLGDYSGETATIDLDKGYQYILNLDGHNMSGNFTFNITNGSSLTINGDNDKTNLDANFVVESEIIPNDNGSGIKEVIPSYLTINGGNYTTTQNCCINADGAAEVTLNSGIFQGAKAATNKQYQCLNHTEGHETAFYIYEDGIKYLVGDLGEGGQRVIVERCEIMPFKVEYSFDRYPFNQTNFTSYSGTALLGTFASTFYLANSNENFNNITEGSATCKNIKATITLQCNYKSFGKEYITIGNDANIILDLKSSGCKMDAICEFEAGGTLGQYTAGCTLTIFADDYKTNLEGSFQVSCASNVTINGGTYKGTDYGLNVKSGEVTINNGTFSGSTATIHKNAIYGKVLLGDKRYYFDSPNAKLKLDPQPTFNTDGNLITTDKSVTVKKDNQAYAVLSSDGKTLTFKYDEYYEPNDNVWEVPENDPKRPLISPEWTNPEDPDIHPETITTVKFEPSFADYYPTTCYRWFLKCSSLETIIGMEYLNPFQVVSTKEMFSGCSSLTSLDLSKFTTSQLLTNMQQMFENCSALEKLDLSNLNTVQVTKMGRLFVNCGQLKELKFGGSFTTNNVQSFVRTFCSCHNLEELDLSTFSTESATDMTNMFGTSEQLKIVKFGKNFKPATKIGAMFFQCLSLQTIIVDNDDWNLSDFESVESLFDYCTNLTGGNGTKYDEDNKANLAYFRIDRDGAPGYLTKLPYTIEYMDADDALKSLTYFPFDNSISFSEYNQSSATVVIPDDVYKDGYTFLGWTQKMSNGKYTTTPSTGISIDPTLDSHNRIYKANWAVIPYTITYNLDGGELPQGAVNPSTYNVESNFTLYNPTREGSEFLGWNNGINDINLATVTIPQGTTGNMTWTAIWKTQSYTITYMLDNETEYQTVDYEFGAPVIPPDNPTNQQYEFQGWYPEIPRIMPAKNVTVTAQWNDNRSTIVFDTDGGSEIKPIIQEIGTDVTEPKAPTKEHFTFDGWEPELPTKMPEIPLTVVAQWKPVIYTITFVLADGTDKTIVQSGNFGDVVTVPTVAAREHYKFVGWDKDIPLTMPDQNLTITAKWSTTLRTITFDTDGAGSIAPIKQDIGTSVTAPDAPSKIGYTFLGWKPALPATMPDEDLTVVAQWLSKSYTITFDTDGGSEIEDITAAFNTAITAPANPTKTGYTFVKWDKDIPATIPDENLTIKAEWNINKYTITIDPGNDTEPIVITQDFNTVIEKPSNPVKPGFTFLGWEPEIPTLMPAENVDVKAQWRDDRVKISAEISSIIKYPVNVEQFCNGTEKSVSLPYTITNGTASGYKVTFSNGAIPDVVGNVDDTHLIIIAIPDNIETGVYSGTVTFTGNELNYASDEYSIKIETNIPRKDAAVQLYSDMLLANNNNGNCKDYQWYRNGEPLSGATLAHYYNAELSGSYVVKVATTDGKEYMSCPVIISTAKVAKTSVNVYPNPVNKGENFTIKIEEYDPAKEYTIMIFSANGSLVKKLSNVEQSTEINLPLGIYSGTLISGNDKAVFKVIVK